MKPEIWKAVEGYEGLYEVSSYGRVKSIARVSAGLRCPTIIKEKILKGSLVLGYPTVGLCKNGVQKIFTVHRLVAVAFLNYVPDGRELEIDHINGLRDDNYAVNLRIVTRQFNMTYGFRKNRKYFTPPKMERKIGKNWSEIYSQYVGVYWSKEHKMWYSKVAIYGVYKHLGFYKSEETAARMYESKLTEIHCGINY